MENVNSVNQSTTTVADDNRNTFKRQNSNEAINNFVNGNEIVQVEVLNNHTNDQKTFFKRDPKVFIQNLKVYFKQIKFFIF